MLDRELLETSSSLLPFRKRIQSIVGPGGLDKEKSPSFLSVGGWTVVVLLFKLHTIVSVRVGLRSLSKTGLTSIFKYRGPHWFITVQTRASTVFRRFFLQNKFQLFII